jgi:hypothetical protein
MRITFTKWVPAAIALCLAVMAAMGRGQAPAAGAPHPQDRDGSYVRFLGAEAMLGDRLVTGAPFTADVVNEFKQTLSDGTQIDRKTTGSIARDSMGRTRREMTPPAIGPFATSGAPTIILINDPVAHKHYALNPKEKTAHELGQAPRFGAMGRDGRGAGGGGVRNGVRGGARPGGAEGMRGGEPVTVSLGTKTIDGVTVEGTRTTRTIPAGTIGNVKAIEIVFERWYSPDLLTNVYTRRSDPFSGETVFQLTNIKRAEPAASLFQVPSDYKLQSGRPGYGGQAGRRPGQGQGMHHGGPNGGAPNSNSNPAPPPPPPPSDPPATGQGQDN